uniref:Uncharacterized protein n=1 Tax=Arundo donax TaxID=35708 RepID=A0A0A9GTV8_ARUDO
MTLPLMKRTTMKMRVSSTPKLPIGIGSYL